MHQVTLGVYRHMTILVMLFIHCVCCRCTCRSLSSVSILSTADTPLMYFSIYVSPSTVFWSFWEAAIWARLSRSSRSSDACYNCVQRTLLVYNVFFSIKVTEGSFCSESFLTSKGHFHQKLYDILLLSRQGNIYVEHVSVRYTPKVNYTNFQY